MDPIFHSNMNSLQIGAHHQYHSGVAFGAEYQWTRVLGTENLQNPSGFTPSDSYGPIAGIAPQVLTVNYSYLFPFGHGRALLSDATGFVDKLVSGWQVSGITVFQNGQPFSVTYSAPGSYTDASGNVWTNLASGRANRVTGVPLYPSAQTNKQWFNPAAFAAPTNAAGIPGGAYGNSGYDMLRGPRYQSWDMNLEKNIEWKERYRVQLRADCIQRLQSSKLQCAKLQYQQHVNGWDDHVGKQHANVPAAHRRVRSQVQLLAGAANLAVSPLRWRS